MYTPILLATPTTSNYNNVTKSMADDKVLVEKDGQFELVSASDITSTSTTKELSTSDFKRDESFTKDETADERVNDRQLYLIADQNAQSQTPDDGCSSQKTSKTSSSQVRTVSAPSKYRRATERDKLNQTAFQTWLQQKDNQLTEQRKAERLKWQASINKHGPTDSEREKGFQAWLASKKRHASATARVHEDCDGESRDERTKKNDLAFEVWIKKKQTEKLRSFEYEKQRLKDLEETAKSVDPEMCQRVYKR